MTRQPGSQKKRKVYLNGDEVEISPAKFPFLNSTFSLRGQVMNWALDCRRFFYLPPQDYIGQPILGSIAVILDKELGVESECLRLSFSTWAIL